MEEVDVTDWEAEAKALRQQIVELEGQRKSSVLSRVVLLRPIPNSLPSKQFRWCTGTRRQTTSLRRRSSIVSPTPLGVVVCEAFGFERRSGNGRPMECCGAHSAFGWCQDAGECQVQRDEKWQESSVWYAGVSSRRRTQDQHSRVQGFFMGVMQWEFDLTRGDDEPLVPTTIGAVPPFPTWVDDNCQTPESQISTPFVRVGAAASRRLRREGRIVVPRIHECLPVDGEVPVSAHRGEF